MVSLSKKRIVSLVLVFVIALLITSCNGTIYQNNETETTGTTAATTTTTTETTQTTQATQTTETSAEKTYDFSEGSEAKDFEVELLTGEKVKLSDYRGKVVLLNLWATWCGYCVKELPELQKLHEDLGDELVVFTINCGEDKNKAEDFINKNKYTFMVGIDKELKLGYPVRTIPITFIINKEGIITDKLIGAVDNAYEYFKEEAEKANK